MAIVVANWKMNGSKLQARTFMEALRVQLEDAEALPRVVICPSAPYLELVFQHVKAGIFLGGQDCSIHESGAFTGDIAAPMLHDTGCSFVIVGHSERRMYCGETSGIIAIKASQALKAGLTPIICVGETLEARASGNAEAIVCQQLRESFVGLSDGASIVVAYEPIWSIGTGIVPSTSQIDAMHRAIKETRAQPFPVLYGGSVNDSNASEIAALDTVDGVLVGGASLKIESFMTIIKSFSKG